MHSRHPPRRTCRATSALRQHYLSTRARPSHPHIAGSNSSINTPSNNNNLQLHRLAQDEHLRITLNRQFQGLGLVRIRGMCRLADLKECLRQRRQLPKPPRTTLRCSKGVQVGRVLAPSSSTNLPRSVNITSGLIPTSLWVAEVVAWANERILEVTPSVTGQAQPQDVLAT